MTDPARPDRQVAFKAPGGAISAIMGGLIGLGSLGGAGFALAAMPGFDLRTTLIAAAGLIGGLALAFGFVNSARQPMLRVEPGRLTIPTFFGTREIAVAPGQKVGELLATPASGGNRSGSIEGNRFVHFFALDATGQPVLLLALHRATPLLDDIRRALQQVCGLRVEVVPRDRKARRPWPDMAQWHV